MDKTEPMTELSKLEQEIPDWIIKYDQANHQSSAGKAIRFLLQHIEKQKSESRKKIELAWDAAEARRAAREFQHPENIDNVKFPPKDQWIKDNL